MKSLASAATREPGRRQAMEFPNLAAFFEHQCGIFEEYPAVLTDRGGRNSRLSYARLLELSRLTAGALRRQGVRPGDVVMLCAEAGPEWLIAHFGVLLAGAVHLGLPADASREACLRAVERFEPAAVLAQRRALTASLRDHHPRLPVILLHRTGELSIPTLRELLDRERTAIGRLGYSSGLRRQTGDPAALVLTVPEEPDSRAIVLTHGNFLANAESLVLVLASTEEDRILSSVPLPTATGLLLLYFSMRNGTQLCFSEPQALADGIRLCRPTILCADTETIREMVAGYARGRLGESLMRVLVRGLFLSILRTEARVRAALTERRAAFREPHALDRLKNAMVFVAVGLLGRLRRAGDFLHGFRPSELFGAPRLLFTAGQGLDERTEYFLRGIDIPVAAGYWLPEGTGLLACRSLQFTGRRARLVAETVGPMLPNTELRLVSNQASDVTTNPGAAGEVFVRGPQIMQGYFHDIEATREVLDENGWLRTGDHGRLTISGELQLETRRDARSRFRARRV